MADMDQARRRLAMMSEEAPEEATNLKTNEDVADEGWRDVLKFFLEDKENAPGDDSIQPSFDLMDLFPPEAGASLAAKLGALKGMPLMMAAIKRQTPTGKTLRVVGKSRAKPFLDPDGALSPESAARITEKHRELGDDFQKKRKYGNWDSPFFDSYLKNKVDQQDDLYAIKWNASKSRRMKAEAEKKSKDASVEKRYTKRMKALMGEK